MKKKFFLIAILSAALLAFAACGGDNAESTGATEATDAATEATEDASDEATEATDATDASEEETEPFEDLTVEEKLIRLWRLDLPTKAENQTLHDDTVNNVITYFPENFSFDESLDDGKTVVFSDNEEDTHITVSVLPNSNGLSFEEYTDNLAGNYDFVTTRITGANGFTLEGEDDDDKFIQIKGYVTEDKIATAMLSYPDAMDETYDTEEWCFRIFFVGLDEKGDALTYDVK
ncbi:MAG: hypothetical protein IJC39_03235 [Firmicutes bacterium]|nr:hypothetical protein [Bacillota bacterium]